MSEFLEIRELLHDTAAAIARLEREMAAAPFSETLVAHMRSLQKRREQLEIRFHEVADEVGVDICTYRMHPQAVTPSVLSISKALGDFQSLFTVVYVALREGPRIRARIRELDVKDSSFGIAYTFSGSFGVVLTIPNERLLLTGSRLDDSIRKIQELAQSRTPDEVRRISHDLGPAVVRKAYRWAQDHAESGMGADLEWRRGDDVRFEMLIQEPEFRALAEVIGATSDVEEEVVSTVGVLLGVDVPRKTFHFRANDIGEVSGRFSDAISEHHAVTVPRTYQAELRKSTKIQYSLEQDDVEWFLIGLSPTVDSPSS
jgi:hypothetical protein